MKTHMCMDIEGFMNNATFPAGFVRMFKHDDGSSMTPEEARSELFNQLRMGRRVIPLTACDNFDYQKGCLGHPDAQSAAGEGSKEGK